MSHHRPTSTRLTLAAAAAAATIGLAGCGSLSAQSAGGEFPGDRPITMVVPYDAGGSSDTLVRALEPYISDELGTDLVVENRVGAGGQVGLTEIAGANPDGTTIGLTNLPSSLAYLNPDKRATYDRDDFDLLGTVNRFQWTVATAADAEWDDLGDLLTAAQADPGGITVGTDGVTGDDHMAALQLAEDAGVEFTYVPYDSGSEKLTALIGGQIDVSFGSVPTFDAQFETGDVKPLAVLQDEPVEGLDAAPASEQGADLTWSSFNVIAAPAGLPDDVRSTLEGAIADGVEAALADDDFVRRMEQGGFVVEAGTADDADATWSDYEKTFGDLMPIARRTAS